MAKAKKSYGMRSAAKTRSAPKKAKTTLRRKGGTPEDAKAYWKLENARNLLGKQKPGGINVTKRPSSLAAEKARDKTKAKGKLGGKKVKAKLSAKYQRKTTAAKKTLARYNKLYGK